MHVHDIMVDNAEMQKKEFNKSSNEEPQLGESTERTLKNAALFIAAHLGMGGS